MGKHKVPGFFTISMLNRNIIAGKAIRGIDPDPPENVRDVEKWYNLQEEKWIESHQVKKISEAKSYWSYEQNEEQNKVGEQK